MRFGNNDLNNTGAKIIKTVACMVYVVHQTKTNMAPANSNFW